MGKYRILDENLWGLKGVNHYSRYMSTSVIPNILLG